MGKSKLSFRQRRQFHFYKKEKHFSSAFSLLAAQSSLISSIVDAAAGDADIEIQILWSIDGLDGYVVPYRLVCIAYNTSSVSLLTIEMKRFDRFREKKDFIAFVNQIEQINCDIELVGWDVALHKNLEQQNGWVFQLIFEVNVQSSHLPAQIDIKDFKVLGHGGSHTLWMTGWLCIH